MERSDDEPDQEPLIPRTVIDLASQRRFVISLFVLIQCWKIYDVLLVRANSYANLGKTGSDIEVSFTLLNSFTFVLKYVVVDGLYLWLLPILNIPLLTFLPLVTIGFILATNAFTIFLGSNLALPILSSTVLPIWKAVHKHRELTLVGDSRASQNVINIESHFKGKYTVHYLPASSVMMNPFGLKPCLNPFFQLPIEFNTTSQIVHLQLERTSPLNEKSLIDITSAELAKLRRKDYSHLVAENGYVSNDDRVFYLEVKIKEPGLYRIKSVLDSDGSSIRPYRSELLIGSCPSAKFEYSGPKLAYSGYKCIDPKNATIDAEWKLPLVSSTGVFPLTVEVASRFNGKQIHVFNATVNDQGDSEGLKWLQTKLLTRNSLEQKLLQNLELTKVPGAGEFAFQILRVADRMGHVQEYNTKSKDPDVHFTVDLRESSRLTLVDKQPNSPLLRGLTKYLHIQNSQRLELPLTILLRHEFTSGEVKDTTYTFNNVEDFRTGIPVSEPGSYAIVSGNDKNCPCFVGGHVTLNVPEPPAVVITGKLISDKCIGVVGFDFSLTFEGAPPFQIQYEVQRNVSGILRPVLNEVGLRFHTRKTDSKSFRFNYKPIQAGEYILKFKSVKDRHYQKSPVSIESDKNTFVTQVRQKSRFQMAEKNLYLVHLCPEQTAMWPISFDGNFPFAFTYEFRDEKNNVVQSRKIADLTSLTYTVESPTFAKTGKYFLQLLDVTDGLGCPAEDISTQKVRISANLETPRVSINSESHTIVEGSYIDVPLRFQDCDFTDSLMSFTHENESGETKFFSVRNSDNVRIKEEGIYRLQSITCGGCPGLVDELDNKIHISFYEKPRLSLEPMAGQVYTPGILLYSLQICAGSSRELHIRLDGHPPFDVRYSVQYPSGKVKSSSMKVERNEIKVNLPTNQVGEYVHKFDHVYDARYTEEKLKRLNYFAKPELVKYATLGAPSLKIKQPSYQVCESALNSGTIRIPAKIIGQAPFTLIGSVLDTQTGIKYPSKSTTDDHEAFDLTVTGEIGKVVSRVGTYVLEISELSDFNGCQTSFLGGTQRVTIQVTPVPSISKVQNKDYYCVGEHVAYNITGVAPFELFYNFNGRSHRAELGPEFLRLASEPGSLSIDALSDASPGSCKVSFVGTPVFETLHLEIKALPSVEISQGESIIKNLHEGDQTEVVFTFTGVPPFEVEFVRYAASDSKRGKAGQAKILETYHVKDIWDHEYVQAVSLEGTYEATRVADAYCSAERLINGVH